MDYRSPAWRGFEKGVEIADDLVNINLVFETFDRMDHGEHQFVMLCVVLKNRQQMFDASGVSKLRYLRKQLLRMRNVTGPATPNYLFQMMGNHV
jgi:hypothetical protein